MENNIHWHYIAYVCYPNVVFNLFDSRFNGTVNNNSIMLSQLPEKEGIIYNNKDMALALLNGEQFFPFVAKGCKTIFDRVVYLARIFIPLRKKIQHHHGMSTGIDALCYIKLPLKSNSQKTRKHDKYGFKTLSFDLSGLNHRLMLDLLP